MNFEQLVGTDFAGFRLEKLIGKGGMGAVFRAQQQRLGRAVAVKVLPPALAHDQELIERFEREAHTVAQLSNPNIIQIFDMGQGPGGLYYIAMEYAGGGSLADCLSRPGPLPEREAARFIRGAARGLQSAAEHGISHRDIKLENILLAEDGSVKIADFGLARAAQSSLQLTRSGTIMGTPQYMPPEQWRDARQCDIRSDLYALGVAYYRLLTKQYPFAGPETFNFMYQHMSDPVPDPRVARPDLSEATVRTLARLLAKRPEDRYQDVASLVADLDAIDPPLAPSTPSAAPPVPAAAAAAGPEQHPPTVMERPMSNVPVMDAPSSERIIAAAGSGWRVAFLFAAVLLALSTGGLGYLFYNASAEARDSRYRMGQLEGQARAADRELQGAKDEAERATARAKELEEKAQVSTRAESTLRVDLSARDTKIAELERNLAAARREAEDAGLSAEALAKEREKAKKAEADAKSLRDRVASLQSELADARRKSSSSPADQAEIARLRREVDKDRENNPNLRLRVTGEKIFLEWAIVFKREPDGSLSVHDHSWGKENEGWFLEPGSTFDLGEGVAAVMHFEKPGDANVHVEQWSVRVPPNSRDIEIDVKW